MDLSKKTKIVQSYTGAIMGSAPARLAAIKERIVRAVSSGKRKLRATNSTTAEEQCF